MSRVWSTTPRTSSFGSRKPFSTSTVPNRFPGAMALHRVLHLPQGDDTAPKEAGAQAVVGVRGGREHEPAGVDRDADPVLAVLEAQRARPALLAQLLDEVGEVLLVEPTLGLQRFLPGPPSLSTSAAARSGTRISWWPVSR